MKPSGGDFCDSIYIGLARDLHPKKLKIVETFHNLSLVHLSMLVLTLTSWLSLKQCQRIGLQQRSKLGTGRGGMNAN